MQPPLLVEELVGKSEVVGERPGSGWIRVGGICAEGVGVPGPHRHIVARARDLARGVELIGVDVVDRNRAAARPQGRDGGIPQPDGVFDQGAGGIVFAEQVAGLVVAVQDGAVDAAGDLDPLAEGVVEGRLGGSAVGQGLESSRVVVAGGDGGIASGVAASIICGSLRDLAPLHCVSVNGIAAFSAGKDGSAESRRRRCRFSCKHAFLRCAASRRRIELSRRLVAEDSNYNRASICCRRSGVVCGRTYRR